MKVIFLLLNLLVFSTVSLAENCSELAVTVEAIVFGKEREGKTTKVLKLIATAKVSAEEKAELWQTFVKHIRTFKPGFTNELYRGSDGSWTFKGHNSESLVIDPEGKVYLSLTQEPYAGWTPPYAKMKPYSPPVKPTNK